MTNQLRMDVRLEAFNLLNRVIWGAPNIDFTNNNFGLITFDGELTASDAVGLKLYW